MKLFNAGLPAQMVALFVGVLSASRNVAAALFAALGVMAFLLGGDVSVAHAALPTLDVTTATTYLETNASTGMSSIAETLFGLAGLAVAIRWVKATFFS